MKNSTHGIIHPACICRLWVLLAIMCPFTSMARQANPEADSLFHWFRTAMGFDQRCPREMVYVHLDNNGYYEDETIWFKAYVVRASTLQPLPLSRVLYVDLLDAGGRIVGQQILSIDSLGRAEGSFPLTLPVQNGFHEIRAYTREMVNWGPEACYSRVVPVFKKPVSRKKALHLSDLNSSDLSILRPEDNTSPSVVSPRIVKTSATCDPRINFYPEGGSRVAGMSQRVAFQVEGDFSPHDSMVVFNPQGQPLMTLEVDRNGRGLFTISPHADGGYVRLKGKKHPLPIPQKEAAYLLSARTEEEVTTLTVCGTPQALQKNNLLGLAVTCRGEMCYFDTLRLCGETIEMELPSSAFHGGVNTVTLFSSSGQTLAQRKIWRDASKRQLHVNVSQNASHHAPYEPIALKFQVHDEQGKPVETDFSVSVRSGSTELSRSNEAGMAAELLLSSELKGYIHQPEQYFPVNSPERRKKLDLLLMIQGWTANTFEEMCQRDSFPTPQPIEEHLTLNGTVFRDNDKREPYPGVDLTLKMYSQKGDVLEARTVTDASGQFAFVSNVDYTGEYIAQFSTVIHGKAVRARVAIDRWFSPQPLAFKAEQLEVSPPDPMTQNMGSAQTFVWEDTIPRMLNTELKEALVRAKRKKYVGFTGNRYTYNGGEKAGMRQGDVFINLSREVERYKDSGGDPGYILDFLSRIEKNNEVQDVMQNNEEPLPEPFFNHEIATNSVSQEDRTNPQGKEVKWKGRSSQVLVNNQPPIIDLSDAPAEWFRSVAVSSGNRLSKFMDIEPNAILPDYLILLYEEPNAYRIQSSKGKEKRNVKGYSVPKEFYHPDYRRCDLPSDADARRTLCWEPHVHTDSNGQATLILYNNGTDGQQLRLSLRGVTARGEFLEADF